MPGDQSRALAEFARACKAAARAVSLYPGAHPAIGGSLSRLASAAGRLSRPSETVLVVHPDHPDDRRPRPGAPGCRDRRARGAPARAPDRNAARRRRPPRRRLARVAAPAGPPASRNCSPRAESARSGPPPGRGHFEIREIDYAEVLRERAGPTARTGTACSPTASRAKRSSSTTRSSTRCSKLLGVLDKFGELLDRLNERAETDGSSVSARIAALMHLLRATIAAVEARKPGGTERRARHRGARHAAPVARDADRAAHEPQAAKPEDAAIAKGVIDRIDDGTIASIVARSVSYRARRLRAVGPGVRSPRARCRPQGTAARLGPRRGRADRIRVGPALPRGVAERGHAC